MSRQAGVFVPSWFVYILRSCSREFTYIGSTNDLWRRFDEHNRGLVQSTRAYRPLEMVAYVAVKNGIAARALEKYFKTGSGSAVLKKRILVSENV